MKKQISISILFFWIIKVGFSNNLPAITPLRAEENYGDLLKNDSLRNLSFFNKLKAIPFNKKKSIYLTLGGEYRLRFEYTKNRNWSSGNEPFYLHRIMFYTDLHLGKNVRIFAQIHNGFVSFKNPIYTQSDKLGLHQGFIDFSFPIKSKTLTIRVGRQEMSLGSGRLVSLRDGPNIRTSFDMARVMFNGKEFSSNLFFGREVKVPNGIFDNNSYNAPYTWGGGINTNIKKIHGNTTLYYIGFDAENIRYNAGVSQETRHTIGVILNGNLGKRFKYNTELNYQFGKFGDKKISAFSIEGDWHYNLINTKFKPDFGIKLDYISGDKRKNDNRLGTFNPYFNNPAYFGLIIQITAMNMFDVHPSIKLKFTEKFTATTEVNIYWRARLEDGLYDGSKALLRADNGSIRRFIGWQSGLSLEYKINRNIKLSNAIYYFVAGNFIKDTGNSKNTFYTATTMWIGF